MATHATAALAEKVLILDFGSQYTQLIARRVREERVYCEIHPHHVSLETVRAFDPKGIILSGGPSSVLDEGAPTVDPGIFELGVPVLGICYGLQLVCHLLGGKVAPGHTREYGPATLAIDEAWGLFKGFKAAEAVDVWMSHGDRVEQLPEGFTVLGHSEGAPLAAIADPERRIFGVQFHPEVPTRRGATRSSAPSSRDACELTGTWTMASFVDSAVAAIRAQVGEGKVLCGLSGGVDSSVAAALLHKAIGDRLTCIFVDNGLLRLGEAEQVQEVFRDRFHIPLVFVDAADRFLEKLAGVTDPEEKRKIIGREFIAVFEEAAEASTAPGSSPRAPSTPTSSSPSP